MRGQPRWCSAGSATLWYALSSLAFLLATWIRQNNINLKRDSICRKTHALVTQRGHVKSLELFLRAVQTTTLRNLFKEAKIFLWGGMCLKKRGNLLIRDTLSTTEEWYSQHFYFLLNATENRIESRVWIPHSSLIVLFQVIEKNKASQRQVEWAGKKI